ncbi:hypothetical protein BDFB_008330 [Asbolus verrucosus]|uniref:Uncharacterized protein n=1 Tax=Asbolus verrucosus TaxID=1661398 RepID=A0A482VQW0_ASBVE|nr:hypothetical protein BDFB_008330 [Asbolus verrucosus]
MGHYSLDAAWAIVADSRPPCDTAPSASTHFYANPATPASPQRLFISTPES